MQSESSSNIKFSYSKTKGGELCGTPKFTDSESPMKKNKNFNEFWTPKWEPAVHASINPSSSKSHLNNEYFHISKRVNFYIDQLYFEFYS